MREKLIELLSSIQDEGRAYGADVTAILSNSQIADYLIANGVTVQKKGEWIAQDDTYTRSMCSVCEAKNYDGHENFCPNCGAKMRGAHETD